MAVVTISRQYGAGGLTVGRRVAELLDADFLDSVLVQEVARRMKLPEEAIQRLDERREGIILRLLRALQTAQPDVLPGGSLTTESVEQIPDSDRVGVVVRQIIEEAARSGRSSVIVGRGGAFILKGWPGVFHARLVASRETRIRTEAERTGTSARVAAQRVDSIDRERYEYARHLFGADVADPLHYALVLNTDVLGTETAARLIVQAVASGPAMSGPAAVPK